MKAFGTLGVVSGVHDALFGGVKGPPFPLFGKYADGGSVAAIAFDCEVTYRCCLRQRPMKNVAKKIPPTTPPARAAVFK